MRTVDCCITHSRQTVLTHELDYEWTQSRWSNKSTALGEEHQIRSHSHSLHVLSDTHSTHSVPWGIECSPPEADETNRTGLQRTTVGIPKRNHLGGITVLGWGWFQWLQILRYRRKRRKHVSERIRRSRRMATWIRSPQYGISLGSISPISYKPIELKHTLKRPGHHQISLLIDGILLSIQITLHRYGFVINIIFTVRSPFLLFLAEHNSQIQWSCLEKEGTVNSSGFPLLSNNVDYLVCVITPVAGLNLISNNVTILPLPLHTNHWPSVGRSLWLGTGWEMIPSMKQWVFAITKQVRNAIGYKKRDLMQDSEESFSWSTLSFSSASSWWRWEMRSVVARTF